MALVSYNSWHSACYRLARADKTTADLPYHRKYESARRLTVQ